MSSLDAVLEQVDRAMPIEPHLVQPDLDQRVDRGDRLACRLRLGPPDIGDAMDDLALQVRFLDDVEVNGYEARDEVTVASLDERGARAFGRLSLSPFPPRTFLIRRER